MGLWTLGFRIPPTLVGSVRSCPAYNEFTTKLNSSSTDDQISIVRDHVHLIIRIAPSMSGQDGGKGLLMLAHVETTTALVKKWLDSEDWEKSTPVGWT